MVYNILKYRLPEYVYPASSSTSFSDGTVLSPTASLPKPITGIPEGLEFDKIVSGGTCPPMTCRDMMKYLLYVERDAENLQFFLWYRDYVQRFDKLSATDKALSADTAQLNSSSIQDSTPRLLLSPRNLGTTGREASNFITAAFSKHDLRDPEPAHVFAFDKKLPASTTPWETYSNDDTASGTQFSLSSGEASYETRNIDHRDVSAKAFEAVDVKWQPFTMQPFREEIARVIAIYIAKGSPRELNLSERTRTSVLRALAHTTHPSALQPVQAVVENTLRFQSHPNFIRWSTCNGNDARKSFARVLGMALTLSGVSIGIVIILSSSSRWWRFVSTFLWFVGISTTFAAFNGMCIVLHGLHHQHVRPWEIWEDQFDAEKSGHAASLESIDTGGSNSYEDEPWVQRYKRRSLIRKIFDKETYVQEPILRQIQDTIAVQSLLLGTLITAILTTIIMVIPSAKHF